MRQMNSVEYLDDNKELTEQQLKDLVTYAQGLAHKIINKPRTATGAYGVEVPLTTKEAADEYKTGNLSVEVNEAQASFSEIKVVLNESNGVFREQDTTERFRIAYSRENNRYEVELTGIQPDIMNEFYDTNKNDEDNTVAKIASDALVEHKYHKAGPADIQRLYRLLFQAHEGDVDYDSDQLEIQLREFLDQQNNLE
ncbi:MAG: hypothetical protein JWN28_899 [Candidatus Saccharibacteria bacterium]|nr:hypothetical protein [Candidatus Saccharibacteria bacterium]